MSSQRDTGKGALFALFLVTMIDMIGFGIIIPFLTYLVQDLAESEGVVRIGLWVGLLMTAYSAAQFLSSPFWGSLSDRIGRRPVLMIGLVGNTVFFTAFGLSTTLLFALSMRFMAGVFNEHTEGMTDPANVRIHYVRPAQTPMELMMLNQPFIDSYVKAIEKKRERIAQLQAEIEAMDTAHQVVNIYAINMVASWGTGEGESTDA